MKRLLLIIGVFWFVMPLSRHAVAQTAQILLRPTHIDISTPASRSAVLVRLSEYPTDEVRYRLYNGSKQYYCWDRETGAFITTNSYASAPLAIGTPTSSATFWIPFLRGSNDGTTATYRDRLGPLFATNYCDAPLPPATAMETPFMLSGTLLPGTGLPLAEKYIVLAFSNGVAVSASHSEIGTGEFVIGCDCSHLVDKIEVRTVGNEIAAIAEGAWAVSGSLGNIQMSLVNGVGSVRGSSAPEHDHAIRVYPVPAKQIICLEAEFYFSEAEVFSVTGRRLIHVHFGAVRRATVDLSQLPAGVYIVSVKSNGRPCRRTIVKV
jgi:hypothetical protein